MHAPVGRHSLERGAGLLDAVVGVALMLVVFLGFASAFQLALESVTNNKARAGAIALANERMEYIRSLEYEEVGTDGGVPQGVLPQSESVSLGGLSYTRRVFIAYRDDPKDGEGEEDENDIIADYKIARVDVSWESKNGTRHIVLAARVSPSGLEQSVSGGVLTIAVNDTSGAPVSGADVHIDNDDVSPAVSIDTFTDASGLVSLIGVPEGAGYRIEVEKSGYGSAQTYDVSTENTSPNPGHLTVANGETTSATFEIGVLASKTVLLFDGEGEPVEGVSFSLTGARTIGTGPDGPVYKYDEVLGGTATTVVASLEPDTYEISIDGESEDFDIASSCEPQPEGLAEGDAQTTRLTLVPHTANSLLVDVASSGGSHLEASVEVHRTGFDETRAADSCGQAFFSGLESGAVADGTEYTVDVSADGYQSYSGSADVSGASRISVILNQ